MLKESVTEPAEPVGEESQAASRHRSCAISCVDRDTTEEIEVETLVEDDDEQSPPPMEAECRVDESSEST